MRRCSFLLVFLFLVAQPMFGEDLPADKNEAGSLSAGLSLTRGNSDTKNFNVAFDFAQRIDPKNVLKYNAFYLRADQNGTLTVDRTSFGARDEYTVSPLTYAFGDLHYLRDKFKEIDYLITPTVGVGQHLIKQADFDLSVEGGVGLALEKDSGFSKSSSGALQARQNLSWKFSPTATLGETASGLWKMNHIGDALYHFEASLAGDLTARSQLKLSAMDDYKTRPPVAGIKKNDISIIAAIVMKF